MSDFFGWTQNGVLNFNYMKIIITSSNEFIFEMIKTYDKIPISDFKLIELGHLSKE